MAPFVTVPMMDVKGPDGTTVSGATSRRKVVGQRHRSKKCFAKLSGELSPSWEALILSDDYPLMLTVVNGLGHRDPNGIACVLYVVTSRLASTQ